MRGIVVLFAISVATADLFAQEAAAPPTPIPSATPVVLPSPPKRGFFSRLLHPSASSKSAPKYNNRKLNGLVIDLQISPQPVKLSEVRQLQIKATVSNRGKLNVTLDFPTDQRIEIYLMTSEQTVLTKWSENHAFDEKPGTILVNAGEHVEYNETISTRDLVPNKVFIAEVFLPKYPEVRVRQKFITAP